MNMPPMASSDPPEDIAAILHRHSTEISGSLCVFGDWFGKPMDNLHTMTDYESKEDYVKLSFGEGETLEVWRPRGVKQEAKKRFVIQTADRVRWEWFYYGRPKLPENRFFIEHGMKSGKIEVSANATWYGPVFHPSMLEPAV